MSIKRREFLNGGKYPLSNGVTENLTSEAGRRGMGFKPDEVCLSGIIRRLVETKLDPWLRKTADPLKAGLQFQIQE